MPPTRPTPGPVTQRAAAASAAAPLQSSGGSATGTEDDGYSDDFERSGQWLAKTGLSASGSTGGCRVGV